MKRIYFLFSVFLLSACASSVSTYVKKDELATTYQAILEEAISSSYGSLPGITLSIISSDSEVEWFGASGYDSVDKDTLVSNHSPFRVASITKTFVATAIMRLHEMDSLNIDDPISNHISQAHIDIITAGGYSADSITIKHCLQHTNGFFDYAMGNATYREMMRKNPSKRWSRTDQLKGAMEWGIRIGDPGKQYRYNDTGYILLGEIIEKYYGGSLAAGLRELLSYDKLGLNATWLETLEPSPQYDNRPVRRYFRNDDYTEVDASIDLYGGGGLMSTTHDLAVFFYALFNGEIFSKSETLELMMSEVDWEETGYDQTADIRYKDYRCGFWHHELYGMDIFAHNGLWGSQMYYVPSLETSIAINYTKGAGDRVVKKIVHSIKNALNK